MDLLCNPQSAAERGTLYHIRNKFQHRSVKKTVMEAVEHSQHFVKFTVAGLITVLAIKIL